MARRIAIGLIALGMALFGLAIPSASAAPLPVVSPGLKLDSGADPFACTLGVVGRDSQKRAVAITAGHCTSYVGQPFFYPGQRGLGPIGTVAYRSPEAEQAKGKDYAVIALDTTKVSLSTSGPGLTASSIGTTPAFGAWLTKKGATTGVTSGPMVLRQADGNLQTWVIAGPGDSGGPLVQGTAWVGLVRGIYFSFGPFIYTSSQTILADLNPRGIVGSGFTPSA